MRTALLVSQVAQLSNTFAARDCSTHIVQHS